MLLFEVRSLITALHNVELTSQVIGGEREMLQLNVDMETGLRGFQYTGRDNFLQPYGEAEQLVDLKFSALDRLVSQDSSAEHNVALIHSGFVRWRQLAVIAIARRSDNSIRDSDEDRYQQTLERQHLMDKIRSQYASFDASELLRRKQYLTRVRNACLLTGVICFLIVLGGGIGLALLFRRHKRRSALREEQEELRRSSESLRRMVWGVKDYAILMLDPNGLVVTWNEGAERINGFRAEEIIGRHFSTFYPAEVAALGKPALELKIATQNGRFEEEGWRIRKDGSQYWASVVITALRDEDDRLSGFAKVIRDMPKPEDTERALLTAEALRRAIFNSTNFSKIATDVNGVIQIFNVGAERMLGYDASEVMNKLTPADISDSQEIVTRAKALSGEYAASITPGFEALVFKAARGIEDIYELTYIRKDGSRFPAVVSVTALRDSSSSVIGYLFIGTDNSARKRAEEALIEAGALQAAIFNSANFSSIATDAQGVIQIFNVGAERMLGYSAIDVVNKITPADISDPQELIERAQTLSTELKTLIRPGFEALAFKASRGIEDNYELTYIRKDGSRFPAVVSVTALRDSSDCVIGYLLIGTDNTVRWQIEEKRKQAEEARQTSEAALRRSEDVLNRTGRLAGVGGWDLDLVNLCVNWSSETARLFGCDPTYRPTLEEGIDFYAPEARPLVRAAIAKSMYDGKPWELEIPVIRADGQRIWARVVATAEIADGKAVRLVGAIQDITARVAEQSALKDANTRATLATDSGGIGIWDWDIPSGTLSWNSWMYRLYGMVPQGPAAGNYELWSDHLHPEDRASTEQALQNCVLGIKTFDTSFRIVWDDGSVHHLRATGRPTCDADGRALKIVGANWDVTDLILADEQSRSAMKIAEDSSRIKSDFLANMSHEVRTPLNAIIGMTYLALRADPNQQQKGYLAKISVAAQSLLSLTNDILDFSKNEAGKLQLEHIPFSLDEVLNDLNDIVSQRAEQKNLAIMFSVARDIPKNLMGDPLRLSQVLINLLNNAIKFTEEGEIIVKVVAEAVGADRVQIRFSVCDTGIGMSAEQIANLFQAFNQADPSIRRKFGGTGLGLAISKQLCELMQGAITVESELGKGSTFAITATFDIDLSGLKVSTRPVADALLKKSILVVEDDENTLVLLINMLHSNGFMVRAVSSGEQALGALSGAIKAGEAFDLVLMDWRLPGIDGIETSRRLKAHLKHAKMPAILMISAFEKEEVMGGLNDPSLDGFLVKPIAESLLVATIAAIFSAKSFDSTSESLQKPQQRPASLIGRKVLLVEDNATNRELATELLADLGIEVTIAINGQEGVERIAAEPFDLVLMDIQMPVMDGLTAARMIRADTRFDKLPVLAMTAHAMSGDRERSLYAGMNEHITKPIDPIRLVTTLVRWMPERPEGRPETNAVLVELLPDEDRIPDHLPPFDLATALMRTNGKTKLLRKILLGFRDEFATSVTDLKKLIAQERLEDAERLVHSLKGLAGTLGAKDLAESAAVLELAFRNGRVAGMDILIQAMEQKLIPAIAAVNSLEMQLVQSADRLGS
jgi:PAS domain S-box-containing protein